MAHVEGKAIKAWGVVSRKTLPWELVGTFAKEVEAEREARKRGEDCIVRLGTVRGKCFDWTSLDNPGTEGEDHHAITRRR